MSYDARSTEANWSRRWDQDGCYRAPDLPDGPKFYNYDSGPFPNGPLHMGHVRTYVLGDITARYQRALGKSVLYATEWDAFGLPNELEALRHSVSPADYTAGCIETMQRQLRALGISYDFERIRSTCDAAYYRWTQWLFLRLLEWELVERRNAPVPWCPACRTSLARMQIVDGHCWRCEAEVETRDVPQWFVLLSGFNERLLAGLDELSDWSPRIRNLVRGQVHAGGGRVGGDWIVSRQRAWGAPVPVVHCDACGVVPVPEDRLPVELPGDLDWANGGGTLAAHDGFRDTACPACAAPATRDTDTLDCFFDDIWCQLSPLVDLDAEPGFRTERVDAWMPVDRFHSGFDTVAYLHLHRFFGTVLHERGLLSVAEPIRDHQGHEMVLAAGRKMSKHLGNVVSPSKQMRKHGADAVRLAVLRAAGPSTAVDWRPALIERATALLADVHRFFTTSVEQRLAAVPRDTVETGRPTKAFVALEQSARHTLDEIGRFVEEYRPNAAIDAWERLYVRTRDFAEPRIASARLSAADANGLQEILDALLVSLSLFAPHLAEELWHRTGHRPYVVNQHWPFRDPR